MKKIFLLIPALVLALVTNAAVIEINTGTADALRIALGSAPDGAEIVMAAGTYVESPSNYIAFSGKSVIVRAADGAEVILKPHVPITLSGGARAEIRGIKIDASELCSVNSYSHLIYPSDGADNNRLILDGCEIYGYTEGKAVIASRSSNKLDSLIINNCKFYNHTTRSCVFLENTENKGLKVTNSTFYNIATGSESFGAGIIDDRSTTAEVRVDHCTFYNVVAQNTDYAAIGKIKTSDAIVSNSIFAMPTSTADLRAIRDVATANNCLTYNYTKDSNWGIHGDVTKNNCIKEQDPLFTDAANGDFSFANNWVTMSISPTCGAATDGSDLGDPRWHTAPVLPSSNFASGYQFVGAKAQISGNIWYDGTNDYLYYNDKSANGIATWKIHATRACAVQATLNMNAGTSTDHQFKVEILDADGNSIANVQEAKKTSASGDIVVGSLVFPSEGNYTVKLYNLTSWSSAIIDGVTFVYVGGEVQPMPGTTDIDEAWFYGATRADGKITFPSGKHNEGWVKWNVRFASHAFYKVTLNVNNTAGHNFTVALYRSEADESPITLSEGGDNYSSGSPNAINMGIMEVPAGDYILKVTDAQAWSDAEIRSVNFAYCGGNVINISSSANTSLPVADAWFTSGATRAEGQISYSSWNTEDSWIKWNIAATGTGIYDVSIRVNTTNAHRCAVTIYEEGSSSPITGTPIQESYSETTGTDLDIELGSVSLVNGKNYVVKVTNPVGGSAAKVVTVTFAPASSSAAIVLPATLDFGDAVLSPLAHITGGELYLNEIGDSDPVDQWAQWAVTADHTGTYLFTMGISSDNEQSYRITILDNSLNEVDVFDSNPGSGEKTLKHYFYLVAGDYFVKVENTYPWSHGHVVSLVVTEPTLTIIDQTETTARELAVAQNIQIIRTFTGGMFNTICLPFGINSPKLKNAFGDDVELKVFAGADFDEATSALDLNFNDATSSGISQGTPYLIKPSHDIKNPVFENVEISVTAAGSSSGDYANFKGTLVATDIPAGEDNLFLGPNNLLYFSPDAATPVKGFRAWFQVKGIPNPAHVIKRARIVQGEQILTAIDLVNGEKNNSRKVIENGQLIIIRDGVRYNVMGVKVE